MWISRRYAGYVFAIALSLAFCAASVPAAALDRSNGDFWTYEMSLEMEGVAIVGEMTLTVVDEDTLTVLGESYDVDVMEYSGSISGTGEVEGMSASVSMVYAGFTYELKDGLATVKDDMYIWMNSTLTMGSVEVTMAAESQQVTTSSPPSGSGLVPGEMGTGDSWTETVIETSTYSEWEDGTMTSSSTDTDEKTYSFSIAASEESVVAPAGTFDCLKITIIDESDDSYEVRWYNDDVGYYVKVATYEMGDDTPTMVVELNDYKYSSASKTLMILMVVGGAIALVVVVVVAVMMMKKRRMPQQPMPPSPPPVPPPQ